MPQALRRRRATSGPGLTGSQRSNLDYILENVLDPSAVVPREYQVNVIQLQDGRVINGIIKAETDKAITVRTANETIVVPKAEIESRAVSKLSMMPEGIFEKMTEQEVRDLVAYLRGQAAGAAAEVGSPKPTAVRPWAFTFAPATGPAAGRQVLVLRLDLEGAKAAGQVVRQCPGVVEVAGVDPDAVRPPSPTPGRAASVSAHPPSPAAGVRRQQAEVNDLHVCRPAAVPTRSSRPGCRPH